VEADGLHKVSEAGAPKMTDKEIEGVAADELGVGELEGLCEGAQNLRIQVIGIPVTDHVLEKVKELRHLLVGKAALRSSLTFRRGTAFPVCQDLLQELPMSSLHR